MRVVPNNSSHAETQCDNSAAAADQALLNTAASSTTGVDQPLLNSSDSAANSEVLILPTVTVEKQQQQQPIVELSAEPISAEQVVFTNGSAHVPVSADSERGNLSKQLSPLSAVETSRMDSEKVPKVQINGVESLLKNIAAEPSSARSAILALKASKLSKKQNSTTPEHQTNLESLLKPPKQLKNGVESSTTGATILALKASRPAPNIEAEVLTKKDSAEAIQTSTESGPLVEACCVCCKESDLTLCPHCKIIYYCGDVHRDIHRPDNICFPFIVRSSQKAAGRYMIAARDIAPLELILWEEPAVVGPYSKAGSGCLNCLKKVDGKYLCSGCQFPMCSAVCEKSTYHQDECKFLQEKDDTLKKLFSPTQNGNGSTTEKVSERVGNNGIERRNTSTSPLWITPLRMLLKKKSDKKMFDRISMLRDHTAPKEYGFSNNNSDLKHEQVSLQVLNVVMLLQDACAGTEETFSQQDIQRMIGILKTNGMKLEPHGPEKGISGVGLYPIYCLLNHSCYSNTNYVKFPDYHLELRSQVPIKRGEEISTRYISATIGNMRRREDIRRFWYFDCQCPRCSDPTELGSYMSAVICFACKLGFLVPTDSLQYKSDWKCDSCGNLQSYDLVNEVISTIESQIGVIETGEIEHLEEMLYHFSNLLHPNHYILIDIMHNLVHLYAAKKVLTRPEKERKIQLCVIVLETLVKIDPGYTKWRGTLLQEMIHSVMLVSKEDYAKKRITAKEFHKRLAMCAKKVEEAKKCLRGGFTSENHESKQSTINRTRRKTEAEEESKKKIAELVGEQTECESETVVQDPPTIES